MNDKIYVQQLRIKDLVGLLEQKIEARKEFEASEKNRYGYELKESKVEDIVSGQFVYFKMVEKTSVFRNGVLCDKTLQTTIISATPSNINMYVERLDLDSGSVTFQDRNMQYAGDLLASL